MRGHVISIGKPADSHALAGQHIGAREVGIWGVLIVAVAFWANIARGTTPGDVPEAGAILNRVLDSGAFNVFAWCLVLARTSRMWGAEPASRWQIWMNFLVGGIALAPVRVASAVSLALLGGLLLRGRRVLPAGRQIGLMLLALAFEAAWTSQLLAPLHVLVGRADAAICAFLLGLLNIVAVAHANVVNNISGNFSIVIWPPCASSLPLGCVSLAFLTMVLYLGRPLRLRLLPWLVLAFIGSILLTEIRLVLLAISEANYLWWHTGPGVSVYALAALALAVLFPVLATREGAPPAALPHDRRVA